MSSFIVKSNLRTYTVNIEPGTAWKHLLDEHRDGDVVIIDQNIAEHCIIPGAHMVIRAEETQKSYMGIHPIIERLIDMGFKRNNRLIAIGGGIIQDITSFIASTLYRGVEWIFFPSTLLAQADSCIGSKTSINFGEYKNQLGGFYPPSKIFIDTELLNTLPRKEFVSGLGEMCHYFLIDGKDCFNRFEDLYDKAVSSDQTSISELVATSLHIKKKMVEVDEFDRGPRNIFNYGHTFGHAIETMSGYAISHGVAVSIGMDIANYVSLKLGMVDEDFYSNVHDFLKKIYSGTDMSFLDMDKYIDAMKKDKKNEDGRLGLILTYGYGVMFKYMVAPDNDFRKIVMDYMEGEYE